MQLEVRLVMSALAGRRRCHTPHATNGSAGCRLTWHAMDNHTAGGHTSDVMKRPAGCCLRRHSCQNTSSFMPVTLYPSLCFMKYNQYLKHTKLSKLMKFVITIQVYQSKQILHNPFVDNDFWVVIRVSQSIPTEDGAAFHHLRRRLL